MGPGVGGRRPAAARGVLVAGGARAVAQALTVELDAVATAARRADGRPLYVVA